MNEQNQLDVAQTYGGIDPLAAIEAQAAAHDQQAFGGMGAGAQPEPEQPAFDSRMEAEVIVKTALSFVTPFYPSLEKVYTPEQVKKIAEVSAPLMDKYGLSTGGVLEKWGAELMFAVTMWPIGQATIAAIREDNAIRAAKEVANDDSVKAAA